MKPPPFEYARPETAEEALTLLSSEGAKVLAGGQSLVPLLNLRLAHPALLVDVNRLPGLDRVERGPDGGLRLGALVRHHRLLEDPAVADAAPLLPMAAAEVGHPAIRNRGTLGGSLVHGDPAAELAVAMVALDAQLRLLSARGERLVPARGFYVGPFVTAIEEDELLVEVLVPARPAAERAAFLELAPRQGDFAIAAVAALITFDGGRLAGATVAWSGATPVPELASELSRALSGARIEGDEIEKACREAAARTSPTAEFRGDAGFKRQALGVLAARAVRAAAGGAA